MLRLFEQIMLDLGMRQSIKIAEIVRLCTRSEGGADFARRWARSSERLALREVGGEDALLSVCICSVVLLCECERGRDRATFRVGFIPFG